MEKKKIKFNIIDVIIILAVVALGVFVVNKFTGFGESVIAPEKKTCHITFYKEEVANYVIENTHIGDPVWDDSGSTDLGRVCDMKTNESVSFEVSVDKIVRGTRPDYSSLYLTSEVEGTPSEYGVVVDGTLYTVGHTTVLRAGYGKYYITVQNIEFVD